MKKVYLLAIAILIFLSCKERIKMEKIANLYKEVKYHEQAISYQAEYFIGSWLLLSRAFRCEGL